MYISNHVMPGAFRFIRAPGSYRLKGIRNMNNKRMNNKSAYLPKQLGGKEREVSSTNVS